MPLPSGIDGIGRISCIVFCQKRQQTLSAEPDVALKSCRIHKCREEIHTACQLFYDLGFNPVTPADSKRNMYAGIIAVAFGMRERHPVVCSDNHNSIVQFSSALQLIKTFDELVVEPLDLDGIVKKVFPDIICFRQESGNIRIVRTQSFKRP